MRTICSRISIHISCQSHHSTQRRKSTNDVLMSVTLGLAAYASVYMRVIGSSHAIASNEQGNGDVDGAVTVNCLSAKEVA